MTTYTKDALWTDVLPAVAADDSIPNRTDSRAAICAAITRAAAEHHRYVHASWVRPYLPAWINPPQIGAIVGALQRSGHLTQTSRPALPNGGTASGNGTKLSRVTYLAKDIEAEWVAA